MPDYRLRRRGDDPRNTNLKVPVLRFPRWSFCMYCKRLELSPLSMAQPVECPDPKHKQDDGGAKRKAPRMSQVPFVTVCAYGHLDDFPFREWLRKSHHPGRNGTLRLESRGGGGLEGQVVVCDPDGSRNGCGKERSLEGIMNSHWDNQVEHTYLTDQLVTKEQPYSCKGARLWLAQTEGSCGEPIRGALRGAGNVYFPKVESSIYLPRQVGAVSAALHDLLNGADVRPILRMLNRLDGANVTADQIRADVPHELFHPITDEELLAGYRDMFGIDSAANRRRRRRGRRRRRWRGRRVSHQHRRLAPPRGPVAPRPASRRPAYRHRSGHAPRTDRAARPRPTNRDADRDAGAARLHPGPRRRPEALGRQGSATSAHAVART